MTTTARVRTIPGNIEDDFPPFCSSPMPAQTPGKIYRLDRSMMLESLGQRGLAGYLIACPECGEVHFAPIEKYVVPGDPDDLTYLTLCGELVFSSCCGWRGILVEGVFYRFQPDAPVTRMIARDVPTKQQGKPQVMADK